MSGLFATGRIFDLILALMAIEATLLWAYRLSTGRGILLPGILISLAAGACLLMAMRAIIANDGWEVAAFWLTAALISHIADLATRWR
jgi:hypothetical protein